MDPGRRSTNGGFTPPIGSGQYSFGRFRADLLENLYLEHAGKEVRRDSILSVYARLTLAHTSTGNTCRSICRIPSAARISNGDPELRAFPDYRFRAPDNMVFEVEFNRRIWKPLGIMVFYDPGKVAAQASDLSLARMRQSVGGGLTLWSATKVVLRAYVGFGGGQGSHTFVGILPRRDPSPRPIAPINAAPDFAHRRQRE